MNLLADHLWQSTLFAGVVWLLALALALKKNRARVRYWIWLAASLKFLVPLAVISGLSSRMEWREVPNAPTVSAVVAEVSAPFTTPVVAAATAPAKRSSLPAVLLGIWGCGFIGISWAWFVRWWRVLAVVRSGITVELGLPLRVMCAPTVLEPGVFGAVRPVLMLPSGIFERLTPDQLSSVVEHELCHVRHRDNLTAAIHMLVETVFWFHPLVWWIGKRMVEERERGCDEEVVRRGGEARVYAEAILNICRLYVESPLKCVAGVTGADLKKRIEGIMARRVALRLSFTKKMTLACVGVVALAIPVVVGALHAQSAAAQPGLKFEVASVRPTGEDADGSTMKVPRVGGGRAAVTDAHRRIDFENINLFGLIVQAYGIRGCRPRGEGSCPLLAGGPDWMRKDGFTVLAKIPADAPDQTLTQLYNGHAPEVQLMLQALLADRFALRVHFITKELPEYALTVGKKGPKLKISDGSKSRPPMFRPSVGPDGVRMIQLIVENGSMQEVVDLYAKFLDRPAVDRTGLKDRYDFTMDYEANPDSAAPFTELTGPGLFRAFEEQLGLKWVAAKGPVDILVIDHAEKPSEN